MISTDQQRILVLDDDPIVTRMLCAVLAEEKSFLVTAFHSPLDALASLDQTPYDVIVADFLMPEMDGIEFLKQVRERQPVATRILMTGYADKQNAIRAINEVGLYHYFEKPWDNDQLLLVLRYAAERSRMVRLLEQRITELSERDEILARFRARLLKAIL